MKLLTNEERESTNENFDEERMAYIEEKEKLLKAVNTSKIVKLSNILTEDAAAARSHKGLEPYEGREPLAELLECEKKALTSNGKEEQNKRKGERITLDDENRGLGDATRKVQMS